MTHQLALSENPFPPLPSVRCAIEESVAQANRYPEFLPERLPTMISEHLALDPDQVVVGIGATGVAMQIIQAVLRPDMNMVFASPTFDGFPIMARIAGIACVTVPLDSAGRQDLAALAVAVTGRTGLVIVCRPHNPTGTLVGAAEFEDFLRRIPARVVVVLDEAYVEFIAAAERLDLDRLLREHPNLLVLRTFSKAFGLAGLRIGYAFGTADLIALVRRWQLPFGMSTAAVPAVAASYAAERELRGRVDRITVERERLRNALSSAGIDVPASHANFLYLPGPNAAQRLSRAGIVAKPYPDGSARIAVGDPLAGRAVLRALAVEAPRPTIWWAA